MAAQDIVRAFALPGEGPRLREPETRKQTSRRIRKFRSQLQEYLASLDFQASYQAMGKRAGFEAVSASGTATNLFVISLLPPDIYPSGTSSPATFRSPRTATYDLARLPTRRGSSTTLGSGGVGITNVNDTFVTGVPDPGQTSREYIKDLPAKIAQFESDVRNGFRQLDDINNLLVLDRREDRDTFLDRNEKLQDARSFSADTDLRLLRQQVELIRDLPPLAMLINPTSLTRSYSPIISDGNRSRTGYIVENWGEQLPTISASGSIGAYMINATNSFGEGTGGLYVQANGSASYQNFATLYQIYRHNGYILNEDQTIALVGAVQIYYNGWIYTGSFDSFSIEFSETSPFNLNYSFDFTVRYEVDTKRNDT